MSAPRIVAIGGGTGLSTMLRGLKTVTPELTAIVTVADNGGGSGILRRELGILPPGDIRACIQALADSESALSELLGYRFEEGSLKGQSFGNLFLAALNGTVGSFEAAVKRMCEVLAITGRVLPVTNRDVQLCAVFADGAEVRGECEIAEYKRSSASPIERVTLSPALPPALPECLDAIRRADLILLGPGSLYTSVMPNLLVDGICKAIHESGAVKLYIANLMTQLGETEQYTAADHVRALFRHGGDGLFTHCLLNSRPIASEYLPSYLAENASPLIGDDEGLRALGVTPVYAPVALSGSELVRHDPAALAEAVISLYRTLRREA